MSKTKDERPLRQHGMASIFDVWKAKRESNGNRTFFENGDRETMVYLANKSGEATLKRKDEKVHEPITAKG